MTPRAARAHNRSQGSESGHRRQRRPGTRQPPCSGVRARPRWPFCGSMRPSTRTRWWGPREKPPRSCWRSAWPLRKAGTRVSSPSDFVRLRRVVSRRARVVRATHHASGAVVTRPGSCRAARCRRGRRARASREREHRCEYNQRQSGHPGTYASHVFSSPCAQTSRAVGPYPACSHLDRGRTAAPVLACRAFDAEVPASEAVLRPHGASVAQAATGGHIALRTVPRAKQPLVVLAHTLVVCGAPGAQAPTRVPLAVFDDHCAPPSRHCADTVALARHANIAARAAATGMPDSLSGHTRHGPRRTHAPPSRVRTDHTSSAKGCAHGRGRGLDLRR